MRESCAKLFPGVEITYKMLSIGYSPIGDYRSSLAFQLAQKVKRKPLEVANMLVEDLMASKSEYRKLLSEVTATGQGFVSFTCDTNWLVHQSTHADSLKIKSLRPGKPRRVLIDHGSPNMSKEFHVGHIRSIMIGDCLARVLRYQGHEVETVSHVGDFGTPMGLVIAHAMRTRDWAKPENASSTLLPPPSELSNLYIEAKAAQKTDPSLASEVSRCVAEIQKSESDPSVDREVLRVYKLICEASRVGFEDVYKDLDVSIPEKGESFYGSRIPSTIEELRAKDMLTEDAGALVCKLDSWKAPLLVEKSDKTWLYGTTDLACIRYRTQEKKYDDVLYVVDFTQSQHFEQVFEAARLAGWYNPEETRVEHVQFGVVQGSNGQKLSSRDGTPLKLRQLLDDAVVETRQALIAARSLVRADRQEQEAEPMSLEEKMAEPKRFGIVEDAEIAVASEIATNAAKDGSSSASKTTASTAKLNPASLALAEENAPKVAFNAIKYFELSQTRTNNYIFSFQSMLSFKGNTSFYIIYAYARIHTLYKRAADQGIKIPELSNDDSPLMTPENLAALTPKERDLALKLLQTPDVLRSVEFNLMPHTLSQHVFQTSQKFHSFYESCRVIGSPNQDFRFQLCKATERILSRGLDLLNVEGVHHV